MTEREKDSKIVRQKYRHKKKIKRAQKTYSHESSSNELRWTKDELRQTKSENTMQWQKVRKAVRQLDKNTKRQ